MLKFLLRVIAILLLVVAAAVAAYTFVGDLGPETEERRVPVEIDGGG